MIAINLGVVSKKREKGCQQGSIVGTRQHLGLLMPKEGEGEDKKMDYLEGVDHVCCIE